MTPQRPGGELEVEKEDVMLSSGVHNNTCIRPQGKDGIHLNTRLRPMEDGL
ncbi:hypothetical protein Tco_1171496, partial [Tanacetum coccineum]